MKKQILLMAIIATILVSCKPNEPEEATPTALFSFAQNELKVTFTNASQNAQSYVWAFGDGQTSTANSPLHTYSSAGTYKVTLSAYNGSKTNSISQNVTLTEQAPKASFTYIPEEYISSPSRTGSTDRTDLPV